MSEAIAPLPQHAFMAWCLVKHRHNFTFVSDFCGLNNKALLIGSEKSEHAIILH